MSQEPYPKTERAKAGETPTEHTPSRSELEHEQAEAGTPPDETVPDEVAEEAARSEDPLTEPGGPAPKQDDPMHETGSTSDEQGVPSGDV